jgi:Domain of unknown function (DUF4350)
MRQRLLIFGALISLVVLLIGLNAASYVQKQKVPDNEFMPNRSSFNAGTTGTQALYSLLSETGRKVVRWQEPPDGLRTAAARNKPAVFVVIGHTKREFTEPEAADLYQWVYEGGRLVIADRESAENLTRTIGNWKISFAQDEKDPGLYSIDPADQAQITTGVTAAKPVQPSLYTAQVNGVQPSRLASTIEIQRVVLKSETGGQGSGTGTAPPPLSKAPPPPPPKAAPRQSPTPAIDEDEGNYYEEDEPANKVNRPTMAANRSANAGSRPKEVYTVKGRSPEEEEEEGESYTAPASQPVPVDGSSPVVHLANDKKTVLVDVSYGRGKIVYLSDPYILSNAGIALVDNSQLAINVLGTSGGAIAFDEYHQGFGTNNNRLFQYFAGTPVIAIFVQCIILVGFIFFSQSRRFARAVPVPEPNRLSKLEYVSAMAELQARTRAFDLAIENIYTEFRRRAAKLLGVDNYTTTRRELSVLIAERTKMDPNVVEDVLFKCEDIMHGEPTNKKEILALIGRLRAIEEKLGMKRTGRTKIS